ncbi:hypothetical protein FQA39_LY14151 [Lamprigera yunnana]|nr:hypothetical protein FQA39_LY14151 [Lamprigera yunnana]
MANQDRQVELWLLEEDEDIIKGAPCSDDEVSDHLEVQVENTDSEEDGDNDLADGEKYEKLFKQIKQNENKLQNQNLENIRINKELTTNFNKQLENIKFNEMNLKSKIEKIETFIKTQMQWQQIFSIKDIFNQLISISINLIEIIEEIETSLSFCNINLIHSSIVLPKDLFNITKQIFDENKLSFQNFWSFSKLIKSHCTLTGNMIRYLLEILLYSETDYDLYELTAISTIVNNKIVTLNIPQQLIYKDNYKLFDITNCIFNNGYYCRTNFIEKNECISQLFQNHLNLEKCNYHKIEREFHMYQIEKSPYIVIVSPDIKLISIECPNYSRKSNVKEIYKFNNKNDCFRLECSLIVPTKIDKTYENNLQSQDAEAVDY